MNYLSDISKSNYFYSGSFELDLGERWGMFSEYFGDAQNRIQPRHNLDFGFTYLMKVNIQIDSFAGTVVGSSDTDWFSGLGISVRLPR